MRQAREGDVSPILDAEADALFAGFPVSGAVVVGVSGGPDSVALLGLLAERSRRHALDVRLCAATVDHGLRPDSAAEAEGVGRLCAEWGVPHSILTWQGEKPRTALQERAREARYRLLVDHGDAAEAGMLITAHTLDDQAETLMMRMAAGSGLAGLVGMTALSFTNGLMHARPFLAVRKARLVATCRARGWRFVEDPSNTDTRFARARWRRLLPLLEEEGLTPERLGRLAQRLGRANAALDVEVRRQFGASPVQDGARHYDLNGLRHTGLELMCRGLIRILRAGVENSAATLRYERCEALATKFMAALDEHKPLSATLGGQMLKLDAAGQLRVMPEPPRRRGRGATTGEGAAGSVHRFGRASLGTGTGDA